MIFVAAICINYKIPYGRKYWLGIKFGGLTVYITTTKVKSLKLAIAILGSTAKFNSRQYFRLYGTIYYSMKATVLFQLSIESSALATLTVVAAQPSGILMTWIA